MSRLARDELQYVAPADRDVAAGADRSKPAALNRALRRLYPKDVLAKASHLVAVLDDDQARIGLQDGIRRLLARAAWAALQVNPSCLQVADRSFLQKLLPCMGTPGVCLVYTPPGYSNVAPAFDVFDQVWSGTACACHPGCSTEV